MKKTICFFAFVFAVCCAEAAFIHPGSNCTDKPRLAASMATAETPTQKLIITVLMELADKTPETFKEFCTMVDTAASGIKFPDEATRSRIANQYKKQFVLRAGKLNKFYADAIEFAVTNSSSFDIYFCTDNGASKLLTPIQRYQTILKYLLKYDYKPAAAKNFIRTFLLLAGTLNDIDVKGDLIRLNRHFSLKLAEDQTAWTPVVQMIRTAMSTY